MTENIHEKLAPDSSLESGKLIISYDLQSSTAGIKGQMYYTVSTDNASLWLDVEKTKKGVSLKKGTQLLAKANASPSMLYVLVVSGDHKLDQGYVHLGDLKNKKAGPLPAIVAKSTVQGKTDIEYQGGDYLYLSSRGKKAVKLPDSTVKLANKDLYMVFDTYKDKKGEYYLALRDKPAAGKAGGSVKAELADGTLVEKLEVSTSNSSWWKIKVFSGPSQKMIGWSHSKWLKKYETSGGQLAAGTMLSYVGKPRKNSKYIKVKVLNGRAAGLTGYVARQFTKSLPKTPTSSNIVVELPFREALQKLNNKFAVERIKGITGREWVSLKDPTSIPALYKDLKGLADLAPDTYVSKILAFYNTSDDTIDILQPFYFAAGFNQANHALQKDLVKSLKEKFKDIEWACEPLAKLAADEALIVAAMEAEETEVPDVTMKMLAEGMLDGTDQWTFGGTVAEMIAERAAKFFEFKPEVFKDWFLFNIDKTIVTFNPKIYNSPRWGYFTFKIPVTEFQDAIATQVLTAEAANFLTDLSQGTTLGTAEVHGFLAKIPRLKENTAQISTGVKFIEDRLVTLGMSATNHNYALEDAKKTLWRDTGKGQEQQRPLPEQLRNLRSFPAFLKSALIRGPLTPENVRSLEPMAVRIDIQKGDDLHILAQPPDPKTGKTATKKQVKNELLGLSSIVLENTFLRESTSVRSPTIETVNEKKQAETILLRYGKLVVMEKRFVDEIDKELAKIDLYKMAEEVLKVEEILFAQPSDKLPLLAPDEYVFQKAGLRGYLVYMLADIVRRGTQERRFDFDDKVPDNLQRNILENGKAVSIEDYDFLTSYEVGMIPPNIIRYTPDFPYLLKQIRWLNITEGATFNEASGESGTPTMTAKIGWNFLQIKLFVIDSNQILKNYGPPEYSFLMGINKKTFNALRSVENEKDFFDQLYTYKIFYLPAALPSPPSPMPPAPDRKLLAPLTPAEKQKILDELFAQRYKLTEQAFGPSGCIVFALKTVRSLEDLYSNVMYKADWPLFLAQLIDRFKCELSKMGGGDLACLADFDVMGTYQDSLDAIETIENFPEFLKLELQKQPTAPIMNMIYDRKIPSIPSIDWYKCLRGFLLALVIKLVTDLIIAFVQNILDLLGVQCDIDFSSCEKSELDSDSPDLDPTPATVRGDLTASGMPLNLPQGFVDALATFLRNSQIDEKVTPAFIREFVRFLGENMSVVHFKALLTEDTPVHIFSHGKFLANNFFAPIKFSDEQFRVLLKIINSVYSYDALIAAQLAEIALPDPNCPPDKYNDGASIVGAIKDALKQKIKAETGADDASAEHSADVALNGAREDLEEKISAFCEVLNFAGGAMTEINAAPALLAGVANAGIAGTVSQLVTTLRIKPFTDYTMLRYLFTGDAFSDNPSKDDIVRADLSLAYNVLYRNYWLTKVHPDPYYKNYELRPEGFRNSLPDRWGHVNTMLSADSFEKEFLQDLLKVTSIICPFMLPFYPLIEAALFNVKKPLNGFDKTLLGASRDLNNSNYFYAWAEALIALIPFLDPRRFGTKYKDFVKQNYPNASGGKLIEPAFVLKTTFDDAGLRYTYTNGNITLMDLRIGMTDFSVMINDERTKFTRDLPKLSEPFFVDEAQDYLSIVDTYSKINTKLNVVNPQKKIYNALVESGLEKMGLYSGSGVEGLIDSMIAETFDNSYGRIDAELRANLENADEKVAKFFFKPFMEANKAFAGKTEAQWKAISKDKEKLKTFMAELQALGNPRSPAVLFFQRSDNIFSEVFFEESVTDDVAKIVRKVEASLKSFYKDLSDGAPYNPKALANAMAQGEADPSAFYEVEKLASSKYSDWLSRQSMHEPMQKAMLEAVKEVSP